VTDDLLGTLGLAALFLGAVSVGAALPWPAGACLLAAGMILWGVWGR